MSDNPFAPPTAPLRDVAESPEAAPPLWNPNAAAGWSLLFSPAFGAFLQMRNWQRLGHPDRAQTSLFWFIGMLLVPLALGVADLVQPDSRTLDRLTRPLGIVLLLAWYFGHGLQQVNYVKTRFRGDYPRRGWGVPILVALGATAACFALLVGLAFALDLWQSATV